MGKQFRPEVTLKGNRSGNLVRELKGPPNSYVRGGGDHVFETDGQGKVIRDIDPHRVKVRIRNKAPNGEVFEEMEKTGKPLSAADRAVLRAMGVLKDG